MFGFNKLFLVVCLSILVFGMGACTGETGPPGLQGERGPAGPAGPPGPAPTPASPSPDQGVPDSDCDYTAELGRPLLGTNQDDILCGDATANEIRGGDGEDTISGFGGDDKLYGDDDDDNLYGGPGNDKLYGGDEDDELYGGPGNDELYGGDGENAFDGGTGSDTVVYVEATGDTTGVVINLAQTYSENNYGDEDSYVNIENVKGTGLGDTLTGNDAGNVLTGGEGADTLDGGEGNDTLIGGEGADTLDGGEGNDTLIGGEGADTLDGGEGFDYVSYEDSTSAVTVDLNQGQSAGDTISNIEGIIGSPQPVDTLEGKTDVSNTLNSGKGADTLIGNGGKNTFIIVYEQGVVETIMDFELPPEGQSAAQDIIHLKGFPTGTGQRTIAVDTTDDTQITVGDNPVIEFSDMATAAAVVMKYRTLIRFVN